MAKLKNPEIRMKRLVAMLCMTVSISLSVWSQKPQTGFSDLRHGRSAHNATVQVVPQQPAYSIDTGYDDGRYDSDEDGIWTCTSYLNLGYIYDQTLLIGGTDYGFNAKWGGALQVGNSYMFPKKAFFDRLKVGIDATWFDFSGAKYDETFNDRYHRYHLTAGMGIGASLHIAPFAGMGDKLSPVRLEGYFRFVPSYSLLLISPHDAYTGIDEEAGTESEKTSAYGAFLPVVSFGFALNYRAIGVGYEHRTGGAHYKDLTGDGIKTKFDLTSNRVYISWRM